MKESLKCSYSFKAIQLTFRLFIWAGTRWFLGKLRRGSELFRHSFSETVNSNIRLLILRNSVRHIYGLTEINYAKDELIVLCVVRNGEAYIKSFIEHYFALGAKHIVFLFNDSTDSSILLACQYKNVTVLETACPYKKYETAMKKYLVSRFSKNKWNIFSDIDELFDYPFSDVISLKSLLTYLNTKNYTAVVAQMLDLFSDKSLASLKSEKDDSIKDIYGYYDISNLEKEKYRYGTLLNQDVKFHRGGIRKTLFGTRNGLTKAALIFAHKNMRTFVDYHHVSSNARIADITCVLLHYPFSSNFYEKVMEAAKTRRYEQSADREYQMYWDRLKKEPNLSMKQETACKLESVNCLLQNGFLVVSEDYLQWVKTQRNPSAPLPVLTSEVFPNSI